MKRSWICSAYSSTRASCWIHGWCVPDFWVHFWATGAELMYSGYHSDTMVNNLFAYAPDGKVIFCAINFPGSWHDGSIMADFLPYIHKKIGTYKMCVDQGLPRTGDAVDVLVGPISCTQAYWLAPNLGPYLLCLSNVYVSLCQASDCIGFCSPAQRQWLHRQSSGCSPRVNLKIVLSSLLSRG